MNFDVYSFLEKDFLSWCDENFLQVEKVKDSLFQCGDKIFLLLEEKDGNIFDANFHFILNTWEKSIIKEVDSVVYKWGTRFYYTDVSVMEQPDNDNIKEFKYIGTTTLHTPGLPFLGVRGQYEILNGSRNYVDWVSKAQFLDISVLGICEKNTLAGTMAFQQSCQKKDIKSILGETITINNGKDLFFEGKVFALNHKGWQNILQTNAEINVINPSQFVSEERLLGLGEGVAFVFDPLTCPYDVFTIKKYQKAFDLCYFKLDSVQYENGRTDQTLLESTQQYLNNSLGLKPILLCDAYYLDKDDFEIKKNLNLIAGVKSATSHNQYFKSDDENLVLFSELFREQDFGTVLLEASESLLQLSEKSDWIIPTGKFNLPEYKMNPDEVELYDNRDDLFDALVFAGWEKYRLSEKSNVDVYLDRLQEEVEVLRAGGFIDYFLILHDIIKWCEENDILVGVGRGSAAGSLVSYLLDITKVDPIKYGLLFERFLNKGRLGLVTKALINETIEVNSNLTVHAKRDGKKIQVEAEQLKAGDVALDLINEPVIVETVQTFTRKTKGTVPDIDTDFESTRRDEVKQYMENKYGADRVCSIGSYTSLQMRAVFRDFCKLRNVPLTTVNLLSKIMFETRDNKNARASKAPWEYIFKLASRSQALYDFIQDNADMIEETRLCHAAPRAASVHPCATLILPEGESIYTSVPIRKTEMNNSELIVTEWEGPYVEAAGYLKEDILGIIQLDKFRMIINLVKEHYGEEVSIYSIPLDEPGVFDMISKGLTSDVFQLGSKGLTAYCMQVKPTSVEELCAMVALFRPGPMENNFHLEYVAVKNGKKELTYMPGLEDITKETYGLLAYQEQIMLITTHLADFTMQEADNIRKGMGKVDKKFFAEQGQKFIDGAVRNGYDKEYIEDLWESMCSFGGYAYNKSHALSYAMTAYISQYLKWKYPLPYWITAFEFANDDNLPRFISEMNKIGDIVVTPPDINKSELVFHADFSTKKIIWSISKVKQCGPVATAHIFEERDKNGPFFDLKDLIFRVDKSKVNKSVVENLILAGAFDEICDIKMPSQRKRLLHEYRDLAGTKVDKNKDFLSLAIEDGKINFEWWWLLQQKRISGLAIFDYYSILRDNGYDGSKYLSLEEFEYEDMQGRGTRLVTTAGIVNEIEYKTSKKGDFCRIRLEQNYAFVYLTLWNEEYQKWAKELQNCEGKILCVKARAYFDTFKQENSLQSDSSFEMTLLS